MSASIPTAASAVDQRRFRALVALLIRDNIRTLAEVIERGGPLRGYRLDMLEEALEAARQTRETAGVRAAARILNGADKWAPVAKPQFWLPFEEMRLTNLQVKTVYGRATYLVWSPVEIWKIFRRELSRVNCLHLVSILTGEYHYMVDCDWKLPKSEESGDFTPNRPMSGTIGTSAGSALIQIRQRLGATPETRPEPLLRAIASIVL